MLNKDIAKLLANSLNNHRFVEHWLNHVAKIHYEEGQKLKTK